jgi:hypothetical protein
MIKTAMHYGPDNVFKFLFPWQNIEYNMKVLLQKYIFFNSVRVWLYLTVSKLDFNVLVIPIMHFGLGLTDVLCPFALTSIFDTGIFLELDLENIVDECTPAIFFSLHIPAKSISKKFNIRLARFFLKFWFCTFQVTPRR